MVERNLKKVCGEGAAASLELVALNPVSKGHDLTGCGESLKGKKNRKKASLGG
jgi:hypothetical protein